VIVLLPMDEGWELAPECCRRLALEERLKEPGARIVRDLARNTWAVQRPGPACRPITIHEHPEGQ